ncbi:F0F1 ATP synthase subunit B [Lapidilactobacillus luobeiensis]|uniref:F0F1 ATP synthase subunit B n=1 Tax=Lapidilactobacillus luobeiensis TaxID=2950371 RepID=UPI0021C4390C|nr:F0F1 ATP synthase subunit B [Lapidilactobacillus luobeiensis]
MANGLIIAAKATQDGSLGDSLVLIIAFILLLILLKIFAWKPVVKMMDDRQKKISDDLDGAADSRAKAEEMAAKRQAELKNSKAEAIQIVNTAKENGEKRRDQIVSDAQTEAAHVKDKAHSDADQVRTEALNSARAQVGQIAIDIAESLIKKDLDATDQQTLIDAYIKGLTNADETK